MYSCVKYTSAYESPEYHGVGFKDESTYLRVNSAGVYDGVPPALGIQRKEGRKDFYFAYNLAGTSYIRAAGEVLTSGAGTAFYYLPDEDQYYWYDTAHPLKCYWVHFTGHAARELLDASGLTSRRVGVLGFAPDVADHISGIIDEINALRPGYEQLAAARLAQMIALCGRYLLAQATSDKGDKQLRVYDSMEHIRENYRQDISISALAERAGMSLNHFSLIFKQTVGMSPQQYLTDYRLQQAIRLLCYGNMRIQDIALEIGYEDPMYFSRVFKKHILVSPSEFFHQQAAQTRTRI